MWDHPFPGECECLKSVSLVNATWIFTAEVTVMSPIPLNTPASASFGETLLPSLSSTKRPEPCIEARLSATVTRQPEVFSKITGFFSRRTDDLVPEISRGTTLLAISWVDQCAILLTVYNGVPLLGPLFASSLARLSSRRFFSSVGLSERSLSKWRNCRCLCWPYRQIGITNSLVVILCSSKI